MSLIFSPHHPLHLPTLTQYSAAFEVPAPISTFARSHNVPSKRLGMPFVKCVESVDAIRPTVEPAFLIRLGFMQHRVAMHFSANVFCNSRPPGRHHRPAGATTLSQLLCGLFDLYFYRPGLQRIFF